MEFRFGPCSPFAIAIGTINAKMSAGVADQPKSATTDSGATERRYAGRVEKKRVCVFTKSDLCPARISNYAMKRNVIALQNASTTPSVVLRVGAMRMVNVTPTGDSNWLILYV